MKVGSLCSGIEGFGLGFEQEGHEIAWLCEKDPKARAILRYHYPNIPIYDDICTLSGFDVEPVDILIAGTPCTDLSISGKRAGLDGSQSRLFFEFIRILRELQPSWFVFENVVGLLSSHKGRDMDTALRLMASSGDDLPYGVSYSILGASELGVPQRRRRVIVVGHLGDARAEEVFPEPASSDGHSQAGRRSSSHVAALTATGVGTCGADDNQAQAGHLLPATVTALTARCGNTQDDQQIGQLIPVAFHLTQDPITSTRVFPAMGAGNATGCATMGVMAFSENQRAEVIEHEHAHQLNGLGGKPGQGYAAIRQDMEVRRLMPVECEALMGLPAGWTEWGIDEGGNTIRIADSHRYRCCGNSVVVPMSAVVARGINAVEASQQIEEAA